MNGWRCALACGVAIVMNCPGCAGRKGVVLAEAASTTPPASEGGRGAAPASDERAMARERLLAGRGDGLEMHRLIAPTEKFASVRELLSSFRAEGAGFGEEAIATLRANGVRVAAVPTGQLAEVMERLAVEPTIDTTWLGQAAEWTAVTAGPKFDGPTMLLVDGVERRFDEGRMRMVVRAYTVKTIRGPRLRMELRLQCHVRETNPLVPDRHGMLMKGEFIESCSTMVDLDGSEAIVITTDGPRVEWRNAETERAEGDRATTATTEPAAAMGPEGLALRTVGEEILGARDGNRRLILVLAARVRGAGAEFPAN